MTPRFLCLQDGVRRGVRHGEILDVVVGMRYYRPERPIIFGEHPAPVGSGEARPSVRWARGTIPRNFRLCVYHRGHAARRRST